MERPARDFVHARRSGQSLQWTLNEARPPPSRVGLMADALAGRAGDGVWSPRSTTKRSLVNSPVALRTGGTLAITSKPASPSVLARRPVGIGRVAHDLGLVLFVGHALEQLANGVTVGHVGRGDGHLGDELGVGVDREVGLVAVEAAVPRLVAVAGLGVDGRDDPVLGHAADDAKDPVVALFGVLAGDEGQQLGGRQRSAGRASPSRTPRAASASRTSASTSASRAALSSQSHGGLPTVAYSSSRNRAARTAAASGLPA